jgi:hypothetical protein
MPLMMNEGYNLLAALGRSEPGNPALVVDPGTYRVEACSFAGDPDALLTSVRLG